VSKLGNETSLSECSHRPEVLDLDHHCLLDLPFAQVGDDAVTTGGRVLHDTCVAVDRDAVCPLIAHSQTVAITYDMSPSSRSPLR
jgi:hypothetical protein